MKLITIVKAVQTCSTVPAQWDAWDTDGNYWYLRFRGGHGSMGKDYDVDNAVRSFHVDEVDVTLEEMCEYLGVRLDLGRELSRIELAPVHPENFLSANRKIEIDAPRPGNLKLVIASGDKWATVEIDRLGIDFVTVLQALQEMDEIIDANTDSTDNKRVRREAQGG